MTDFDLGAPVSFSHVITRHSRWDDRARVMVKRWDPVEISGAGIIVGKRTLSNGHVEQVREYDGYFGSTYTHSEWHGAHYFQAYMVAETLRTRPVWVLPEHLAPQEVSA